MPAGRTDAERSAGLDQQAAGQESRIEGERQPPAPETKPSRQTRTSTCSPCPVS